MTDFDFDKKTEELFDKLGESRIMVLATGDGQRISARSMSVVIYERKLYFQTDKTYLKYSQMMKNNNVALCVDNISFEGKCREIGSPLDNKDFCRLYKKYFEGSFNAYTHLDNEVLFEVTPTLIKLWTYKDSLPYIETFDFSHRKYAKIQQTVCSL